MTQQAHYISLLVSGLMVALGVYKITRRQYALGAMYLLFPAALWIVRAFGVEW
jgi:hypothetical protein